MSVEESRRELALLVQKATGHKIGGNSQGGYDCKCGARWDWQSWERDAANMHASLFTADLILSAGYAKEATS